MILLPETVRLFPVNVPRLSSTSHPPPPPHHNHHLLLHILILLLRGRSNSPSHESTSRTQTCLSENNIFLFGPTLIGFLGKELIKFHSRPSESDDSSHDTPHFLRWRWLDSRCVWLQFSIASYNCEPARELEGGGKGKFVRAQRHRSYFRADANFL